MMEKFVAVWVRIWQAQAPWKIPKFTFAGMINDCRLLLIFRFRPQVDLCSTAREAESISFQRGKFNLLSSDSPPKIYINPKFLNLVQQSFKHFKIFSSKCCLNLLLFCFVFIAAPLLWLNHNQYNNISNPFSRPHLNNFSSSFWRYQQLSNHLVKAYRQ